MLRTHSSNIRLDATFDLELGGQLREVNIAFNTYGELNPDRSNAVIVLHALTGWPAVEQWWSAIAGNGCLLDPHKYFIIVPNLLGSCYGTTGPESIDPATGQPYLASFPDITPRDMARLNLALLDACNIDRVHLAIGGSLGGMVTLEMAALAPERFRAIAPIAVSGSHSAWRIAFSSFIRKTIIAFDPSLRDRAKLIEGLCLARQAAMISYRSAAEFDRRFGRVTYGARFEVENYLEHQGDRIAERFSPHSYLTLTRAMELFDMAELRGTLENAAASVECEALFIGISSDLLYDPKEIEQFASLFPNSQYQTLHAVHGHDSFLVDAHALGDILTPWLRQIERTSLLAPIESNIAEEAAI